MSVFRLILAGCFSCLAIYLFVSAPEPLPTETAGEQNLRAVEVERVFHAANAVNDAARRIYTGRIVGPGAKAGLKFSEEWAEPGEEAGPLPALFLRLAAQRLETKSTRLSLYLGSDEPINKSNLFDGPQMAAFERLKETKQPVFSEIENVGTVGMFPDLASAGPCVTCHNEHPDSPKKDWVLNDVMGATTWTYPRATLGAGEYLNTTAQLFDAIEEADGTYLAKAEDFSTPVDIGTGWPDENGMALPDVETFMAEVRKAASADVIESLILIPDVAAAQ